MTHSVLFDRPKLAGLDARSAPDALLQVDHRGRLLLPRDRLGGARLLAEAAHLAFFRDRPGTGSESAQTRAGHRFS